MITLYSTMDDISKQIEDKLNKNNVKFNTVDLKTHINELKRYNIHYARQPVLVANGQTYTVVDLVSKSWKGIIGTQ